MAFTARLSRVTPFAADLTVSPLSTSGCGRGPGDVNLSTTFDSRRVDDDVRVSQVGTWCCLSHSPSHMFLSGAVIAVGSVCACP